MSAMDLAAALRHGAQLLRDAGVPSPEADAQLLAAHLLGCSRGEVQAKALLGIEPPAGFDDLLAARAERIPLQHLTGSAPFRHLTLQVGPGVFTPRPETELLAGLAVDWAEELVRAGRLPVLVDLATGSGAVAAAIAAEVPEAKVYAVELSPLAHAWAQRNLEPFNNAELRLGDLREAFAELAGSVDVLVSNPPYIPAAAVPREPEVRDHDPHLALYGGGADGFQVPTAVVARAAMLLKPGGSFAMEHGEEQGPLARRICQEAGFTQVATWQDYTGRDRVTGGVKPADTGRAAGVCRAH